MSKLRPTLGPRNIWTLSRWQRITWSVSETQQSGDDMAKTIARTKKAPTRRPWSKDDIRLLKGMARKEPASKIAKALKRTEGATRQKAMNIGVSVSMTRKKRAPAKKR